VADDLNSGNCDINPGSAQRRTLAWIATCTLQYDMAITLVITPDAG